MADEIWVKIKDYPLFEVSNMGRVRRIESVCSMVVGNDVINRHMPAKMLKLTTDRKGYVHVWLSNGTTSSGKSKTVQRLVAEAFVPNPYNHHYIKHLDGNLINNEATNLMWVTSTRD